jgi:hypothetical protein
MVEWQGDTGIKYYKRFVKKWPWPNSSNALTFCLEELREIIKNLRKVEALAGVQIFRIKVQSIAATQTPADNGNLKCIEHFVMNATTRIIVFLDVTPCSFAPLVPTWGQKNKTYIATSNQ